MNAQLRADLFSHPELFDWHGPIENAHLGAWLRDRGLERLPDELVQLWEETGGGELFESETILGPFGDRHLGDDIDSVNDFHHGRGLSCNYLVVHRGFGLTAIRLVDNKWVFLDPGTYQELAEYDSFASWYKSVLRAEFAERYGLR